ncbi:MAG: transporter substrate-binding domain-containing protein [Rubellimicrobium sp.]|nr:transporter substrate-binding domain-containing protein [Rubellimicrobium sp.]
MKKLIITTAALALLGGAAAAQDVVRMGTEGAYPPWNFINDNGEVDGFERELGDELCERAGLTCEWVVNDWDTIIPNLVSGNFDVIIAGMSVTEARAEVIAFSTEYYPPTPSAYVGLTPDADINGVVAAQVATIQAGFIAESDATLLEFSTPDETVAAVRSGEADVVFADFDYLLPLVEASGGELSFVGDRVPLGGGVALGLRQSDVDLLEAFNTAIASVAEDGTLAELQARWFAEDSVQ